MQGYLGKRGDSYDRFLIRLREMCESVNIVFQVLTNLTSLSYKDNLSLQKNILEKCQDRDMMDEIDVSNFEKLIDESCTYIENIQTIVKKLTKNESKRLNKRTSKSKS